MADVTVTLNEFVVNGDFGDVSVKRWHPGTGDHAIELGIDNQPGALDGSFDTLSISTQLSEAQALLLYHRLAEILEVSCAAKASQDLKKGDE